MNKAVRELIRALEKVQDWDGTCVGDCIERIGNQESMKPDDYIPMRPVPINERLPKPYDPSITGPQDCDPHGRCWAFYPGHTFEDDFGVDNYPPVWQLCTTFRFSCHWLPHWAFPLPEVES